MTSNELKLHSNQRNKPNALIHRAGDHLVDMGVLERSFNRPRADQTSGPLTRMFIKLNPSEMTADATSEVRLR